MKCQKSLIHLTNQVVWITGSSSGIGQEMAEFAAKNGAHVIISGLDAHEVQNALSRCQQYGNHHMAIVFDLIDLAACQQAYADIMARYGRIDWLINNAGITHRSTVLTTSDEMDDQVFAVNYKAPVRLSKIVLPQMLERKQGNIVMISSIVGLLGTQQRSSYAASKAALHLWANSLRAEVNQQSIQVKVVFPGFVKTNISQTALMPNGKTYGKIDAGQANAMTAQTFAARCWKDLFSSQNYIVVGGARDYFATLLQRISPELLYKIIRKVKVT